jgi:hypothetical protein
MATVSDEPKADQPGPRDEGRAGTKYPGLFADLAAPFHPSEVRFRTQANRQLAYITARTAMNRLDEVMGPENWWDEYIPGENSVLCKLSICLPDGHVLTKCDAGGYAGMADSGDDEKSGISDSFKRSAVKFGIGRYLYRDGVPAFVTDRYPNGDAPPQPPQGQGQGQQYQQQRRPEAAPSQARGPSNPQGDNGRQFQGDGNQRKPYEGSGKPPTSGKGLFAWLKDQEQKHEVGLIRYINGWAKLQDFPFKMTEWDSDQVSQGYAEAVRKIQSLSAGHGDAYEDDLAN